MDSSNISKTRMLILTVVVGSMLLTFIKLIYPRIDITQTILFVTVISIIAAYIIEKFIGSKNTRGKKNE
ncbi:MAG: hypothetical protein HY739_05700 [Desulfobacterales bacterium]|nr:hypothetical protein [Desulfobacterales bacterium]